MLAQLRRAALDLLLPPHCPTCDTEVETEGEFCAACAANIRRITICCDRCGLPLDHAQAPCRHCAAEAPAWNRARGALVYDAYSRGAILPLKHADRTDLAPALARMMLEAGSELIAESDVIVAVPLHRLRLFARRYNQAVLLGRALARLTGLPIVPDALERIRATEPLLDKDHNQRFAETANAIAVRVSRLSAIEGKRVLLIDDVLTSGATATACTEALRIAGAVAVNVLVAARVPDRRRD